MISGRQVLGSIDKAIDEARARTEATEKHIEEIRSDLVGLRQAEAADLRELARVRIDWLSSGKLTERLDTAERQVLALLEKRAAALHTVEARLEAVANERVALDAERKAQAAEVDAAAIAVDEAEARTQGHLDADADYRAQRDRAHDAERTARHADEKAANSESERERKGESYRSDPLFMYLWKRNYGQPGYTASGIVRWLDGKIARLIGFADAHANYSRLNEIPRRLREHAERCKARAEAEFEALRVLDVAERASDGIPALEARLAEEQKKLDSIDGRIEAVEAGAQTTLAEKSKFAAGEDEHTREAVGYLASEFKRDDLSELRRIALATPFPEDDVIVSRLLTRESESREIEVSLEGLKTTQEQDRTKLIELQALHTEFRRHHLDRAGLTFKDGALIASMLGSFLNGMLDRQMLWRILEQQQRYQPRHSRPDFGSGGLGRGTVWNGGLGDIVARGGLGGRGGGTVFGGQRGGGGFRTGGGF